MPPAAFADAARQESLRGQVFAAKPSGMPGRSGAGRTDGYADLGRLAVTDVMAVPLVMAVMAVMAVMTKIIQLKQLTQKKLIAGQYTVAKCNFHAAMAYIKQYPKQDTADLKRHLGLSKCTFINEVVPTMFSLAHHINFLDFNLRFWEWNHTEAFLERVTFVPDGFPIRVCQPRNRFMAALLHSGKYKETLVKGEYVIAIGRWLPN